ncbi:hypothetical protein LCGC14_1226870 [marine sediment metagenome]|uniref:Uncharacterized protein n=1 Tax=marine sediment metagenome TaxID=412755 RepID=A0A0F9NRY0_9ZZZZ
MSKFKRWKIKRKIIQRKERERLEILEPKSEKLRSKIVHHFKRNKKKFMMDILNTVITLIFSIILLGTWGILVAFIPDIMLVFIISDIWQKNPKDKLIGWKLELHLFLHSIVFIGVLFVSLVIVMLMSKEVFNIAWRVTLALGIHIIIDQVTHSEEYGGHFRGYSKSNYKKSVDK